MEKIKRKRHRKIRKHQIREETVKRKRKKVLVIKNLYSYEYIKLRILGKTRLEYRNPEIKLERSRKSLKAVFYLRINNLRQPVNH